MRGRLALVLVLVAVLTIATSLATRPADADAQSGQDTRPPAPAFSVNRLPNGRSLSLSDLRGKVVLVYFFFPT